MNYPDTMGWIEDWHLCDGCDNVSPDVEATDDGRALLCRDCQDDLRELERR